MNSNFRTDSPAEANELVPQNEGLHGQGLHGQGPQSQAPHDHDLPGQGRHSQTLPNPQSGQISATVAVVRRQVSWLKPKWQSWFTDIQQPKNTKLDALLKKEKATTQTLQKKVDAWQRQYNIVIQQKDKFEKTNRKLKVELAELEKQNKGLSADLEEERSFIKHLQAQIRSQEAVVTKAQVAAVARLTENVSSELSDDIIHEEFKELFEETEGWARQNSTKTFRDKYLVKNDQIKMGMLASDSELDPVDRFDIESDTASDTLLEAVLNKEICHGFLQNPYFATSSILRDDERTARELVPNILQQVERHLATNDHTGSLVWRAQIVELLTRKKSNSRESRQNCYEDFMKMFLERYSTLIQQSLDQEELEILLNIVSRFGEFALQLWALKTEIKFEELAYFRHKKFGVHSPEMAAAHIVQLEPGDTRLDGRPISIVVQPLIVALRKADDKKPEKRKIWAKGVVWLSNRRD